jgi:hypothetical protein
MESVMRSCAVGMRCSQELLYISVPCQLPRSHFLEALWVDGRSISNWNTYYPGTLLHCRGHSVKEGSSFVRDYCDYASIRDKKFPQDTVDGKLVSPSSEGNPSQVMLAQANFTRGGLVLVFTVHQGVVNETGILDVVKL